MLHVKFILLHECHQVIAFMALFYLGLFYLTHSATEPLNTQAVSRSPHRKATSRRGSESLVHVRADLHQPLYFTQFEVRFKQDADPARRLKQFKCAISKYSGLTFF